MGIEYRDREIIEKIGELLNHLSEDFKSAYPANPLAGHSRYAERGGA